MSIRRLQDGDGNGISVTDAPVPGCVTLTHWHKAPTPGAALVLPLNAARAIARWLIETADEVERFEADGVAMFAKDGKR
jgi:hypothetical protein